LSLWESSPPENSKNHISQPEGYKSWPASADSMGTTSGTEAQHVTFLVNREAEFKNLGTTLVNTSLFTDCRQKSAATGD